MDALVKEYVKTHYNKDQWVQLIQRQQESEADKMKGNSGAKHGCPTCSMTPTRSILSFGPDTLTTTTTEAEDQYTS